VGGSESCGSGEVEAGACDVAPGVERGDGVALGTSRRPRRCDAIGETAGVETGVNIADGAAVGATVAARCAGIIVDSGLEAAAGVAFAVAEGAAAAPAEVDDLGEVSWLCVVASVFTNFFGGTFGGGVASDFIFWRVLFGSS
jgi:hypothetical protein